MEYKDIRRKFVEISGRYDLVNTDWTDNGADFFLNLGQRYLDRMFDEGGSIARYPVIMTVGQFIAKTVGIRAIHEVWAANADGKFQLEAWTLAGLKEEYSEEFSSVTSGQPTYFAPAILRPAPDTLASVAGMYNVSDLLVYNPTAPAQHFNYNGVVVMPPVDQTYTIELLGLFYSPTLSATLSGTVWTQTMSFWSEVHPEVLIAAAIYRMHSLYNNTGAAADYKSMLFEDLTNLDRDLAEQMLIGDLKLEG